MFERVELDNSPERSASAAGRVERQHGHNDEHFRFVWNLVAAALVVFAQLPLPIVDVHHDLGQLLGAVWAVHRVVHSM